MILDFMQEAIAEARCAMEQGEIPVGAVVVREGEVIARAHNGSGVRDHAELCALALAGDRLDGCDVYVTLEPCPMCGGALLQSRVRRIYFGAYNRLAGAFGTVVDITPAYSHKAEVYGGISESACEELLRSYFQNKR